ncbi:MAG: DNA-formamidopyrimidine glycosylase [Solirubrobacterales bacterium]|nr:DNA-formamidopyrimidine glycosylase [Solirubrobacterales bacterium]
MPELPEVEITTRRLSAAIAGADVESVMAPGMVAVKSVSPPLSALAERRIEGLWRVGKMPVVDFAHADRGAAEASGGEEALSLLVHLMSAGRLQLFDNRASLKDRRSRVLIRLDGGRELRLREFGTKQRAWVRLMASEAIAAEQMVATLGPEAWPAPPLGELERALDQPRHLHPLLRDQRAIAGIGRSWVDEILWEARLSPFKKGADLDSEEVSRLYDALSILDQAIAHYEQVVGETIPDKLPMPLKVHRRQGEPCPRCGATLEAVHYAEYVMSYCPAEQTEGRVLKDRRLSRLLK